jgi:hypothetical protein
MCLLNWRHIYSIDFICSTFFACFMFCLVHFNSSTFVLGWCMCFIDLFSSAFVLTWCVPHQFNSDPIQLICSTFVLVFNQFDLLEPSTIPRSDPVI